MFAQGPLSSISRLVDASSVRLSSYDRTGANQDFVRLEPGATHVLAELEGAGVVKHLWFTLASQDPLHRRNLVLRAYWDGQAHPSVEAPIGDFFGQGWGMRYPFTSLPLAAAPREGHALVCYWPMPFGRGARLTLENQGSLPVDHLYYYVDIERHPEMPDEEGRFHAQYRQELTQPESSLGDKENEWIDGDPAPENRSDAGNYVFCEAEGRGHFVGVQLYVASPTPLWYGEGDDMFCIDGEAWPFSLHGTGTEDYFNTAWGPDEHYLHPYFGIARAPGRENDDYRFGWWGRTHLYRYHLEDPVRFRRSLRASIEHGHANSHTLEMASVAYWYQTLPSRPFAPLAADRAPLEVPDLLEVHRWRDAWRRERGGGRLWGAERPPR